MSTKQLRKPRFWKGQVVQHSGGEFFRIAMICKVGPDRIPMYQLEGSDGGYLEQHLRPLTKRERGPERKS